MSGWIDWIDRLDGELEVQTYIGGVGSFRSVPSEIFNTMLDGLYTLGVAVEAVDEHDRNPTDANELVRNDRLERAIEWMEGLEK